MIRTTDITSFTEYRRRLREHHDQVRETGRPLYVTNKGEAEAVVLSPEAFNELADRAELPEILAMIARSEADLIAGRVGDAREELHHLADRNELKLDS
jgi:PHD/YefM family antitoxin component YafN of YafNO toxin-antitoxin module